MIFTKNSLIKRILICSSTLILLGSLGVTGLNPNTNAKVRHNHTHKVYKRRNHNNHKKYHRSNKRDAKVNKHRKRIPKVATLHILKSNQIKPTIQHTYILSLQKGKRNPVVKHNIKLINQSIIQDINNMSHGQVQTLNSTPDMYMLNISRVARHMINSKANQDSKMISQNNTAEFNRELAHDTNPDNSRDAWSNRGNNDFANQVAKYVYQYINQAREQHGLKPLKISKSAQEVANLRSKQYTHDMEANNTNKLEYENTSGDNTPSDMLAHGYVYHDTNDDDAKALNVFDGNGMTENAGPISIGNLVNEGDNFGDPTISEHNNTPQEIAYNDVNDMLNHDRFTGNGHRITMLSKYAKAVGVSAYYHPHGFIGQDTNYAPSYGGIIQDYLN